MQCSITLESDRNSGNVKMKTISDYRNPYMKEPNLDNIVDQLCMRLQDIKDQEGASRVGMPTCSIEEAEAVRRYYAAFPPLKKGRESPLTYYLPPPAWCRKSAPECKIKMQSELSVSKDWNGKNKKFATGKERRNSYQGQRKNNKKRCNSYGRSFESKECLPEWVTHEGVWDIDTQDPVKEFIRAIALDEGYGTCENTVTDELKEMAHVNRSLHEDAVPDWDDGLDLATEWAITGDLDTRARSPTEQELHAKFEAKFDRNIEALWAKDQSTPDDEYQDLPIDFQELLSSPSDRLFGDPAAEKCSLVSFGESIWSADAPRVSPVSRASPASRAVSTLHARLRPLRLADAAPAPPELDSFALYEDEDIYDALAAVAGTMRSFAAINHSRDRSGFAEVPPRRVQAPARPTAPPRPAAPPAPPAAPDREDLLTAARTHFRPVRREPEREPPRHADGDTFDICGDLDTVEFRRSESGGAFLGDPLERYLEYRGPRTVDYGRLALSPEAQRLLELGEPGLRLRFPLRQRDAAAQTSPEPAPEPERASGAWAPCEECGRAAKKMRRSIWSQRACPACAPPAAPSAAATAAVAAAPPPDELAREWEELVSAISAAHAQYAGGEAGAEEGRGDRKRRHSAALRCAAQCTHPHARFLPCCTLALDRPLTR